MKTTIFNKVYNVPVTIDSEQFVKIGADLDIYVLQNTRLRSVDSISANALDIFGSKYNDKAHSFLIAVDSTGKWSFTGGTTEMEDSTSLTYALFDATTFAFVGFYTLASAGLVTYVSGGNNIANDGEYVAHIIDDVPVSLANAALQAQAALKMIVAKGLDKILNVTEVTDSTNNRLTVTVQLLANQYTCDISSYKVCVLNSKFWKRLQFPFHTAFSGTWYDVGQAVAANYTLDTETRYILLFFKDTYSNVSFPLIYAINP